MLPRNVCPGVTVSRFVPSLSIVASRFAWLDAADADDRDHRADPDRDPERRERRPQAPRAQPVERDPDKLARRHPRRAETPRLQPPLAASLPLVSHDLAVPHLDPPREAARDLARRA